MKNKILYKFSDGVEREIEVSNEFKKEFELLKVEEKRVHRKETRRSVSYNLLLEKQVELPINQPTPEEMYIKQEESKEIRHALKSLTNEEIEILRSIGDRDFDFKDYAAVNNISMHAAYKRIYRLREKAKNLLLAYGIRRSN